MKCPDCRREIRDGSKICPYCGHIFSNVHSPSSASAAQPKKAAQPRKTVKKPHTETEPVKKRVEIKNPVLRNVLSALTALGTLIVVIAAIFFIYYFVRDWQFNRQYTRGALTPQISEITMDNDIPGHAIVFYGEDGDSIYIKELNQSYLIVGGIARIELEDGMWFDDATIETAESVTFSLHPVLISKGTDQRALPTITMKVDVPSSPLTINSPANGRQSVYTAMEALSFHVVPGSKVLINGTDASDQVDRNGDVNYNVNIDPIGDNTFSILVKTENYKETRVDAVYYREALDIDVSLDSTNVETSQTDTVKITGKTEPDSIIVVDSSYVEDSVSVNHETGAFSFIAKLSLVGDNTIRFHAEKDGCDNATISYIVSYEPNVDEYTSKAWAMDYTQLRQLYEQWKGRIFCCKGTVTEVWVEDDTQYVVMDVSTDPETSQPLILINKSAIATPEVGKYYRAYADVDSRMYHNDMYMPLLICRYMFDPN